MKHTTRRVLSLLLALAMLLALLVGTLPVAAVTVAAADPQIGTKLADELFAVDASNEPVFDDREMGMLVQTIKLFMDVDDARGMCDTLNTALVAMAPSGQAGVFLDNGVSFYTAYAISQYILDNESGFTYAKLEDYTGVSDGTRNKEAFAAAINARADDFWSYLEDWGTLTPESFENGLTKMDRVFYFLSLLTAVYPEMFSWSGNAYVGTTRVLAYQPAGTISLDRTRTAALLQLANTQLTNKIDTSSTSSVYDAINQLTVYFNGASTRITAAGKSDRELLFDYLNKYRFLKESASGGNTGGNTGGNSGNTPGGGGTVPGNGNAVGIGNNPNVIIDDEALALGSPVFQVISTVNGNRADAIFRMADWLLIKDSVTEDRLSLDARLDTGTYYYWSFGIEQAVLDAMKAHGVTRLTLMTGNGNISFPVDAYASVMAAFLKDKSESVAATGVLFFDFDTLSATEAFPDGMSVRQKLVYRAGSMIYRNALRTQLTENGVDVIETVPADARPDKYFVLSWPYEPPTGADPDKLTAWRFDADGKADNDGGHFNALSGLYQITATGMGLRTVAPTAVSYADTAKSWAAGVLNRLSANGILTGNNGNARPNDIITRAEFAKMLVLAKKLEVGKTTGQFRDVGSNDWHNVYVAAAVADGFLTGNGDGTFAPARAVTRQEMARMLYLAMGEDAPDADFAALSSSFEADDLKNVADWAKPAVAAVVDTGLMTGKPGPNYIQLLGTGLLFDPLGQATRAEAATVVCRYIDWALAQ